MVKKKGHSRRRAVAGVQVLVMLPVLIGFSATVVDVGVMYNARSDMQRAADAAAMAAISSVAYGDASSDPFALAFEAAQDFVSRNHVLQESLTLDPATDLVLGHAYYDVVANAYNFVPGDMPANAVRVTVRHSDTSPNGPLPLYFASIFGKSATNMSSSSVAMAVQTAFVEGDCYDILPAGSEFMCHFGDSDDSDDSASGDSVDSDDSQAGDSDGGHDGDSDDSDDSEAGDSHDSGHGGHDSGHGGGHDDRIDNSDSESGDNENGHTIIVKSGAVPYWQGKGDTIGTCPCIPGDPDDSDDSESGDSSDSDDSEAFADPNAPPPGPPAPPKVTICHIPPGNPENPQTLSVSEPALTAHLAHGDTNGVCVEDQNIRVFLIE